MVEDLSVVITSLYLLVLAFALIFYHKVSRLEKTFLEMGEDLKFLREDQDHARKVVKALILRMKAGGLFTEEDRVALEILLGSEGLWQEGE